LDIEFFDDLSLLENNETQMSFFKEPMLSPVQTDNKALFESPTNTVFRKRSHQLFSPIKDNKTSFVNMSQLPLDMKIICNSRAEHNFHTMDGFVNVSYMEFWNLTSEEGRTYKDWDKTQFEIQSLIFEIFTNLKKIRFNLHRLIFIYGLEFKDTGFISDNIYDKTFEVLQEFYYYLDKLVVKKLKPLFDDHFFVDDGQVLKILAGWFKQLKLQYRHISGSVVYLSKLSSNEDVRKLIIGISKKDLENSSNRSAVSPIELFNSYFVKLFTSIELLFERLKSVYKEANYMKNFEATDCAVVGIVVMMVVVVVVVSIHYGGAFRVYRYAQRPLCNSNGRDGAGLLLLSKTARSSSLQQGPVLSLHQFVTCTTTYTFNFCVEGKV